MAKIQKNNLNTANDATLDAELRLLKCMKCGIAKLSDSFHKNKSKPTGRDSTCASCICSGRKQRRAERKRKVTRLDEWRGKFLVRVSGTLTPEVLNGFASVFAAGIGGLIERDKL